MLTDPPRARRVLRIGRLDRAPTVTGVAATITVQTVEVVVSKSVVWPWAVRLAWVAVGVTGERVLTTAVEQASTAPVAAIRVIAAVFWIVGVATVAVPAVVSLTAMRIVLPTSLVAAVSIVAVSGIDSGWSVAALIAATVTAVIALSADLGRAYVQASAYGDEDRHLLRPPAAYLVASVVTWLLWSGFAVGAVAAVADRRWVISAVLGGLAAGTVAWGWRRWHRLSRRWLVFVPIGLVVHDHVVLADTWMIRRNDLTGLRLAPASTGAADLTGPATGHALEITVADTVTVVKAASPSRPTGTAIHLTAALVAPSRPGACLRAAAARRLAPG